MEIVGQNALSGNLVKKGEDVMDLSQHDAPMRLGEAAALFGLPVCGHRTEDKVTRSGLERRPWSSTQRGLGRGGEGSPHRVSTPKTPFRGEIFDR